MPAGLLASTSGSTLPGTRFIRTYEKVDDVALGRVQLRITPNRGRLFGVS
jgi:hypothetical protein